MNRTIRGIIKRVLIGLTFVFCCLLSVSWLYCNSMHAAQKVEDGYNLEAKVCPCLMS